MKKLTKKLLITTSTILGLLTIGVGTSIALSSCANRENQNKIDILNNIKNELQSYQIKSLEELTKLSKEEYFDYKKNVSDKLFNYLNTNKLFKKLNNEKITPNKLILELFYNDLKSKVINKEELQKTFKNQVEPIIKDIKVFITNGFLPNTSKEIWTKINQLIDLYINLYKSL